VISTSRTPASVFASVSLKRQRCRSTCATFRSIISPIRKPARPSVACQADRLRLLGELIAEAVDQSGCDLAQPVAAEEPLQVCEPPAVVHERLLGQVELL
jgi:hypothetical protein